MCFRNRSSMTNSIPYRRGKVVELEEKFNRETMAIENFNVV